MPPILVVASALLGLTDPGQAILELGTRDGLLPDDGVAYSIAYSDDGKHIAIGGMSQWALLDAATLEIERSRPGPCRDVRLSPDGKHLACTGGYNRGDVRAAVFDVDTGKLSSVNGAATSSPSASRGLAIGPQSDGALVVARPDAAVVAHGHSLQFFAPGQPTAELVATIALPHEIGDVDTRGAVALSADARTAVVVDAGVAAIVDLARHSVRTIHLEHQGDINAVAISPDGATLAVVGDALTAVRLFSTRDGSEIAIPRRHPTPPSRAAFAPGGRVATVAVDGVRVFAADGALLFFARGVTGDIRAVDAHTFVVAGRGFARISDERGTFSVEGAADERIEARIAPDRASAWRIEDGALVRRDAAGNERERAASPGPVPVTAFDVVDDDDARGDDTGRVAFVAGGAVFFGPARAPRRVPTRRPAIAVRVAKDGNALIVLELERLAAEDVGGGSVVDFITPSGVPLGGCVRAASTFGNPGRVLVDDPPFVRAIDVDNSSEHGSARVLHRRPLGLVLGETVDGARVAVPVAGQLLLVPWEARATVPAFCL